MNRVGDVSEFDFGRELIDSVDAWRERWKKSTGRSFFLPGAEICMAFPTRSTVI